MGSKLPSLVLLLIGTLSAQVSASDFPDQGPVLAEFRGCESALTCRFRIDSPTSLTDAIGLVRLKGLPESAEGDSTAIAVRDRLNSLLSNMIHQHKRIELRCLQKLDEGRYAATVIVNGLDIATDPVLVELMKNVREKDRQY